MKEITDVLVSDEVKKNLIRHDLMKQFYKAVDYILIGSLFFVHFKKRNPPSSGIWYFRVTKKWRALCRFDGSALIIFALDDHQ